MSNSHSRIRIAQLVNYLGRAGKEMGIVKLLSRLNKDLFDCTLIVVNEVYDWSIVNEQDYSLRCLEFAGGNSVKLPLLFRKVFLEGRYDIVHTRSWVNLIDGIIGARLAGIPVVIHQEHGTFPQQWRHRVLQPFFWARADRVLSVSSELADRLSGVTGFARNRIQTILNGVDDSRFYPNPEAHAAFRSRFGLPGDACVVGTVGRFSPVKNFPLLIRGFHKAASQDHQLHCVFTGDGEGEAELRALARGSGLEHRIHFIGIQEEINSILNGYDIFALTSFSEGCSNVIQEAMFAGRPVVATRVGGNPELIEDGVSGLLVTSNDSDELAAALLKLRQNTTLRKRLAVKARADAAERFSLSHMVKTYERVYLEAYCEKFPQALSQAPGAALRRLA